MTRATLAAFAGLALFCTSVQVSGQSITTERIDLPKKGEVVTVSIGGQVHEYANQSVAEGAILNDLVKGGLFGDLIIEPNTPLLRVESKTKFKACVFSISEGRPVSTGFCGLDDDGDAVFDRVALDDVSTAIKLKTKASYTPKRIQMAGTGSFRTILIFTGATADSMRFSYREFSDGMARPAFTEELIIQREAFPQLVAIKNVKMKIHKIDGMGITYEVL